jgi:hypothetical protein
MTNCHLRPLNHPNTHHTTAPNNSINMDGRATEQTPLKSSAEMVESGMATGRSSPTFGRKGHLQSFSNKSKSSPRGVEFGKATAILPPYNRSKSTGNRESDDVLAIRSKQSKNRARKNLGAFRRKRQDYATWKGRVGVHVEADEFDLKALVNVIYTTLSTDWELVDHYDVIRLWLPLDTVQFSGGEENAPSGGGEYAGDGEIHASMPEVFVFGFGAVVFWNFRGEEAEKQVCECRSSANIRLLLYQYCLIVFQLTCLFSTHHFSSGWNNTCFRKRTLWG